MHVAFADGGNGTLVACAASQSAIHNSNASWLHSTILVLAFLLFHTSSLVPAWSGGSVPFEKTSFQSVFPVLCGIRYPLF